jgi:hypothetical protein
MAGADEQGKSEGFDFELRKTLQKFSVKSQQSPDSLNSN